MSTNQRQVDDNDEDLRPEHDLSKAKDGVRGKYFQRYQAGANVALLAPDVRQAFPTDEAVDAALRTVMQSHSA